MHFSQSFYWRLIIVYDAVFKIYKMLMSSPSVRDAAFILRILAQSPEQLFPPPGAFKDLVSGVMTVMWSMDGGH